MAEERGREYTVRSGGETCSKGPYHGMAPHWALGSHLFWSLALWIELTPQEWVSCDRGFSAKTLGLHVRERLKK